MVLGSTPEPLEGYQAPWGDQGQIALLNHSTKQSAHQGRQSQG
jgi:hypothetical protein